MNLELKPDQSLIAPGCPIITLAGREWFVPVLAMRQSRVVFPALMRIMPLLEEMQSGESAAMAALSEENYDAIITAVHAALTRAYPELSREMFLDLPASMQELIAAITVVTRQTGAFKPAASVAPEEKTEEMTNG